ncbi:hypothetical protein [Chryseobacterium sp. OSA05B]|uniref:hypothetical protein n=1 Tax=Chryseobacterium sp. OSA05B TaxID=2862650 RepID=UPI001CBBEF11|nr:hypothetical protein [Chryseobacterium sp. OSA05B]
MKLLIFLLAVINVKSQLLLNIKSFENKNSTTIIVLEIFNSGDKTCKIPIDTTSFKPFYHDHSFDNLRPLIELKYKHKTINYGTKLLELEEKEIDYANKGEKIPDEKSKNSLFEIKPKQKLVIPIKFNPFEFNVENGKYDYFNIDKNRNYSITIYIDNEKKKEQNSNNNESLYFTGQLKSNSIKAKWNLKNRKDIKW